MRRSLGPWAGAAGFALAACGGSSYSAGQNSPDAKTTEVPDASGADGLPVVVQGTAYLENASGQVPAAGAKVEALGIESTTAANDGSWKLTLATNAMLILRATAVDAVGVETPYQVPPGGAFEQDFLTLASTSELTEVANAISATFDTTKKGLVVVELQGATTTNYGVSISATSAGSFGINSENLPVKSAATLSTSSPEVVFYNVTPGTTTVTVEPPMGRSCSPDYVATNYPVDPGIGTQVDFTCD